jgi:hypothetical protein
MSSIHERPLYGNVAYGETNVFVETSPNTGTATWTNQTPTFVGGSVSRGGPEDYRGLVKGTVGTGQLQFYENTNTILPGYWIRLRVQNVGNDGNFWAGFIQDVQTRIIFEGKTTKKIKTLIVCDWVSYVSQFYDEVTTVGNATKLSEAAGSFNLMIDPSYTTYPISNSVDITSGYFLNLVNPGTIADKLNLVTATVPTSAWYSTRVSPTHGTTGLDGLINLTGPNGSTTVTFTDGSHSGTTGYLTYYNDIEINYGSSDISNSTVLTNAPMPITPFDELRGYDYAGTWAKSDSTSVSTYGRRTSSFDVGTYYDDYLLNMVPNPHLSYSSDYLVSGNGNLVLNRQLLTDMATGATNYLTAGATQPVTDAGLYIASGRLSANTPTVIFIYNGPESNGVYPGFSVRPGTQYTGSVYQRGGVGQSSMQARAAIRWYDINGAIISDTNGTATTLTSTAWLRRTVTATAPANAYYAALFAVFLFSGTNNTSNRYFSTAAQFETGASANTWFSGDTADTASNVYYWKDFEGGSASVKATNFLETIASSFITNNKTPLYAPRRLRLNAQGGSAIIRFLELYKTAEVWLQGVKWVQYITGINHTLGNSGPFASRWMIDIELRPAAQI